MQTTGNLGLKKPEGTDIVDITDLNGNMDILDNAVNSKVDKATGKQLSTNDYTTAEKTKLAGVAAGANNYVHPNHTGDVISTADGTTAIAAGVIVNADINATAGIDASKIGTGVVSNMEFGYLDGVSGGIQGQLNGKAPLVTTPQQTTSDITYYVRTDGSDGNTGLANTAGGAFRTIAKAISMVPKVINHIAIINVSTGTYDESIDVSSFIGRLILQAGDTGVGKTNVKSISFNFCNGRLEANGFTATSASITSFMALYSQQVIFTNCYTNVAAPSYNGAEYTFSSGRLEGVNISNRANGIVASWGSMLYVNGTSGSGNTGYGMLAIRSSYIGVETSVYPTGVVSQYASSGSTIVSNGGGGVLNPWGDNTMASRSFIRATAPLSPQQSLAANVWTKVNYSLEAIDQLGEYDPTISRFTAKQTGFYQINTNTTVLNSTVATACELFIYVNGTSYRRLEYILMPVGYSQVLSGSACIPLNAGDYVEIYFRSSTAVSLSTGYDGNFEIIRAA